MGWLDRFLSWIGFELEGDADEAAAGSDPEPARGRERWARRGQSSRPERAVDPRGEARGQLVSLPGGAVQRVIIAVPRSFDDAQVIADHLKNRRPVVVNLEGVERELAQRLIHFLSGTTYALNGEMHRVSAGTVFFAPGGVDVVFEGEPPRGEPGP